MGGSGEKIIITFFPFNTLSSVPKTVPKLCNFISVFRVLFTYTKDGVMKWCLHVCVFVFVGV